MSFGFTDKIFNTDSDYHTYLNMVLRTRLHFRSLSVLLGVTHSRCVCRKHPRNLSLTCPELILPGVRHEIGFRNGGVLRACLPSAAPECHFSAAGTHSDPHGPKPCHSPSKSKLLKKSGPVRHAAPDIWSLKYLQNRNTSKAICIYCIVLAYKAFEYTFKSTPFEINYPKLI